MLELTINKALNNFILDVSFSVNGGILAILGHSGSGKSMTLQCIAGLMKPDYGHITLNGKTLFDSKKDINIPPQQRKIGYVFQNYALFPHMTVWENIAFGIRHLTSKNINSQVSHFLEIMELTEVAHCLPPKISGGQQQRTALARALALEPELLLLDEPFSALDNIIKENMERELIKIQELFGVHTLFVTHNLAEAYKLSSKIALYNEGRIIQLDNKDQVINNPTGICAANLTGMKNIFQGIVKEVSSSKLLVWVEAMQKHLLVSGAKTNIAPKQKVTLGIRSEHILFKKDKAMENTLSGRIIEKVSEITGCSYKLLINDSIFIHAHILGMKEPYTNNPNQCYLHIPPDKLCLIE